ncbi:hypothetical protein QJS66_05990 [Kocuria rhizophila]|nr:hypothetical protein QJS66_05990 [Kocuria rhizophila]
MDSYAPERAGRPDTAELWHKVTTEEDPERTRRYHSLDISEKAFGGPRRSPRGRLRGHGPDRRGGCPPARRGCSPASSTSPSSAPGRGSVAPEEIERFLTVQRLPELKAGELGQLNIAAAVELEKSPKGIF